MARGAEPRFWACEECIYAMNKKRRHKGDTASTCTCRLNGHAYGNVVRCPHRKERQK